MPPKAEPQTDKLFVYGTLRRGYEPHSYLRRQSARFLDDGIISGRLYDLGEYPGAVPSKSPEDEIRGELYELRNPKAHLRILDEVEEFDPQHPEKSLFVRRPAEVRLTSGETVEAWVYFLPRKPRNARLIASGDFGMAQPPAH
jgi:pyruvate carboxylase